MTARNIKTPLFFSRPGLGGNVLQRVQMFCTAHSWCKARAYAHGGRYTITWATPVRLVPDTVLIWSLSVHRAGGANTIAGKNHTFLNLQCVDPSSAWEISVIWHNAGAYHGVFILET